ncbi:MAG: TolC family protein [Bacteroidota bacterium]
MNSINPNQPTPKHSNRGGIFLFLLAILLYGKGFAQIASEAMNLEACIAYGLEHSPTLSKARMDEAIAKKDVNIALASGLPQIEGQADIQNNFELPVFVLPGENGEPQSIPFGLPWQASAGMTVNQLVFDGKFFLGLKAAKTLEELTQISTQRGREQVAFDVSRAYYMVLVSEERLTQLEANLERVEKLYQETDALHREGFAEKLDVERLEINLNNLKAEKDQLEQLIPVNEAVLKFQMGMSVDSSLELVKELGEFEAARLSLEDQAMYDPRNRLEYQALETQRALETLNMRRYKVDFLPNLYAFGNYAWNWQWDAQQDFSFQTGTVGLQLNVPIFDSFRKTNEIQKARINVDKINRDMETLVNSSQLEFRQSLTSLNNSLSRLESQEKNKILADKVYRISRIKYTEGVGSSLEVNEAETQLKQSESLYLNSLLEFILAKLELDKLRGVFRSY